jgi:hypothetical protein
VHTELGWLNVYFETILIDVYLAGCSVCYLPNCSL